MVKTLSPFSSADIVTLMYATVADLQNRSVCVLNIFTAGYDQLKVRSTSTRKWRAGISGGWFMDALSR